MKFSFPSAINITYSEENLVLETKYNIESTQLDNFIAHVTIVNSKFTSKVYLQNGILIIFRNQALRDWNTFLLTPFLFTLCLSKQIYQSQFWWSRKYFLWYVILYSIQMLNYFLIALEPNFSTSNIKMLLPFKFCVFCFSFFVVVVSEVQEARPGEFPWMASLQVHT